MIYDETHLKEYLNLVQRGDVLPTSHTPSTHWEAIARQGFVQSAIQDYLHHRPTINPLEPTPNNQENKKENSSNTDQDKEERIREKEGKEEEISYNHFRIVSLIDIHQYQEEKVPVTPCRPGVRGGLEGMSDLEKRGPLEGKQEEGTVLGAYSLTHLPQCFPPQENTLFSSYGPEGESTRLSITYFLTQYGTCYLYPLSFFNYLLGFGYRATTESRTGSACGSPIMTYTAQACRVYGKPAWGQALLLSEGVADAESLSRIHPWSLACLTAKCTKPLAWFLSFFTNRVVLCLDNDDAGRRGTRHSRANLEKYGIYVSELKLPADLKDPGELLHPKTASRSGAVLMDLRSQLLGLGVT